MRVLGIILSAGMVALSAGVGRADPILFINDYEGFLEAAGDVQTIDFETLPDGTPSMGGEEITPEFNYTDQGVTFSSPYPVLSIGGGAVDFLLQASNPESSARNWITADLVTPATAVGIIFPGGTTLSVYDAVDNLIADASFGASGGGFFLGIVSDVPIATAVGDRGGATEIFQSFLFTPIPEPATLALLALGAATLMRCGRRRKTA